MKKLWASFLLLNLIFSQSFAYFAQGPAKAQNYTPQDLSSLTQEYQPSRSFVISSSSTPLAWENPDQAYVTDLTEEAAASEFNLTNSALLKVTATSTVTLPLAPETSAPAEVVPVATSTQISETASTTQAAPEPVSSTAAAEPSAQETTSTPIVPAEEPTVPAPETLPSSVPEETTSTPAPVQEEIIPAPAPEVPAAEPAPASEPTVSLPDKMQVLAGEAEMTNILQGNTGSLLGPETSNPTVNNIPTPNVDLGNSSPELSPGLPQIAEAPATQTVEPAPSEPVPPVLQETDSVTASSTASSTPTETFVPLLDLIQTEPSVPATASTDTSSSSPVSSDVSTPETAAKTTSTASTYPVPDPSLLVPDLISAPLLEYSGFNLSLPNPDLATGTHPTSLKLKLSLSSLPLTSGRLVLEYALASSSFQSLTIFDLSSGLSNSTRNGLFEAPLPLALYSDLDSLRIRVIYQAEAESLNQYLDQTILFLDGVSVLAAYPDYSWDEEDLAALSLPPLTPEEFSHLEFFGPLLELFMPSDLGTNPITVGSKQKNANILPLRLLPLGVSTSTPPARAGETVTYPNAFSSTDLEYKFTDTGLKENIILKDNTHPVKFRYLINFDGYDPVQVSPSNIVLYQKGHKKDNLYKRYTLSAPVMTDAKGLASDKLVFRLKGNLLTLTPDAAFLKDAVYPVVIDPTVELNILNVSSFPVAGEYWTIDFTTVGQDTLTITPGDEATIQDMDFSTLACGGSIMTPNLLPNGVIEVPNWSCDSVGEVKFLDKKTGHHHMVFSFGSATQDAYNGANVYTGATGGGWEVGSNWSLGTVPTSTDDAVINTAVTVNLNGSTPTVGSLTLGVSGGGTASVLNFNYDASSTPLTTLGDLIIYSGASLTHTGNSTSTVLGRTNLSVGGNATVTGSINVDGKGFDRDQGPGAGTLAGQAVGGSYGGLGGTGSTGVSPSSSLVYGSVVAPVDLGSGGDTAFCAGGDGGGAVKLAVTGTTTVTGSITANGANGACGDAGGGSGGSVNLTTGTLAGNGSITAKGGNMSSSGGSGGGGRIAVYYTTDTSSVAYQPYGGSTRQGLEFRRYAGSGTLYKKAAAQTYGDLILNNNSVGGNDESIVGLSILIASSTFDTITATGSAAFFLANITPVNATATTITLAGNGMYDAKATTTLAYTTLNWGGGMITDSDGYFPVLSQNQDLTIPTSSKLIFNVATSATTTASRTYNNLTVNGILTHTYNNAATSGTASLYKLNWQINGNFVLNSGGSFNLDSRGYWRDQGPGAGTLAGQAVGGSYGGLGGTGSTGVNPPSSLVYGSFSQPTDLGSGGDSAFCSGGVAGGAVKISVTGTSTISGTISANGANGACGDAGGGSGGSVYINGNGLAGNGTISVKGGNMSSSGGSGGGGRIAIYYSNDISTIAYQAFGGSTKSSTRYGGAGTIYKKSSALSFADLIIDNNNIGATTETSFGLTPITFTDTYNSLTVRNSASTYLTASSATATTVTLANNGMYDALQGTTLSYTSLNWDTGMITDSNGSFAVIAQNQDLTVPTSSKLIFNVPNATRTYNNLTVIGTLSHAYNSTATTGSPSLIKLNWQLNGNLNIPSTGLVDVIGRGFPVGQGPGAGYVALGGNNQSSAGQGVGASYGGLGGYSDNGAGGITTYGSLTQPTDLGSGGYLEGGCSAIHGGGAVTFNVTGTTTLSGTINATAAPKVSAGFCDIGGGSGGSVYLNTVGLVGSGTIQARGGDGHDNGSGGGGGRIAVHYTNDASSFTYQVYGGQRPGPGGFGGSGTIFRKSSGQTYGDLSMNNNGQGGNDERILGRTPLGMSAADPMNFDSITATSSAFFYLASSTAPSLNATATNIVISGNAMYDALATSTLAYSSLNWNTGMIRDTGGVFQVISQNQDLLVPTSSKLIFNIATSSNATALRTYNNLTISGTLVHTYNSISATTGTASLYKLNWQINGNLLINAVGSVDLSGRGFAATFGPGAGFNNGSGQGVGASYGGLGSPATGGGTPASVYGSLTTPVDIGSGGWNESNCTSRDGGGAMKFVVTGTTTVSGFMSANAMPKLSAGFCDISGGTGGSIYLVTGGLTGNGTIKAIGGDGHDNGSGGGGGRIAVYYTNDASTLAYQIYGGQVPGPSRFGGSGTVYKKAPAQTYGDLFLDNNNQGGTTSASFGRTPVSSLQVFDNFTLQNSAFLDSTITPATYNIKGNLLLSNTAATSTASLQLSGASPQTITQAGTMPINIPLVINASSTVSLATTLFASSTLAVTSGIFNANSNTASYSSLVTINGGNYQASALPQNFLAGLSQSLGAFTGGTGSVNITGNLNLSGGNFNPAGTLNLSGNLNNTGGTFLATSGTVSLTGTNQTISGNNTFYNFTKTMTVTDTLTFTASSTQTITNTMTLQGAASNLLSLRSTASGTQWNINPQGSRLVAYLDVKDSQNTNFLFINAYGSNSVDSGNNIKWAFFPATLTQSDYRFYQNGDVLQPTSPMALQNATTTVYSSTTPIRLRMNILVSNYYLPSPYQTFKLQVSTSTTSNWLDVGSLPPSPAWWDSNWANRRKIFFNNASSTVNLTNFPVLVALNPALGNISYSNTKAGGADIRFVDADGVTPLNYEIEKWDVSATSSVWVRVPQIDATSTTDYIWMYYNNPAAADNSTTTGVWDSNYVLVQHLKETVGTTTYDSTARGNNGNKVSATEPNPAAGYINGAQAFDGSNDYLNLGRPTTLDLRNSYSLEAWIYATATPSGSGIITEAFAGDNRVQYELGFGLQDAASTLRFGFYDGGGWRLASDSSGIATNQWIHIVGSWNGTVLKLYKNGTEIASNTPGVAGTVGTESFYIGRRHDTFGSQPFFPGFIDEVRISSTTRSSDWILAEYKTSANQYNSYAAEEGAGGTSSGLATWQFYNNPSVASGSVISATLLSTSLVQGTYEESNPTAINPFDVPVGQAIEYDFAVSPQNMLADVPYYFRMVQGNGAALNTYVNYPALMYTYVPDPNPPTGFTATVDSATQISLAWSANGNTSTVQYLVENLTAATNSGWISATATSFSGLACASTYSFTVKARNIIGVESSTVSQTATTPACGLPSGTGGSGVSGFGTRAFCLVINGDAVTTNSSKVTLDISTDAQGVTQIELSDNPSFVGSQKLPYAATIQDWNLCGSNASCSGGIYKVYAKLYNAAGEVSPIISDDINYEPVDVSLPVTVQFTTDAAFGLPSDADVAVGVSLSHATTVPVAVDYAHVGGTAVLGIDYQFTPGTLVIPSGQTAANINFRVASRTAGGTVVLGLANSKLASLGEITQFTYTILGNTPTSTEGDILLTSPGALSNNSSTSYTVRLSKAPTQDVTVTISTDGQTSAAPTSLIFTPANWGIPQSVGLVQIINATSTSYGTIDHTAQSQDPAYRYVTKALVVVLGSPVDFCQQNPTDPTCSFCALNPNDPTCAFCALNPQDPSCTVSDPYCKLYPTDPTCTNFCQQNPTDPTCAYCALHPSDSQCQTQNCQTNPADPACAFCKLYPQDAACTGTKTYCQTNPADPKCQDQVCADPASLACVCHVDPKDPACVTYCQQNSALSDCQFCYINPTDPSCLSFCSLHPQNPTCQDNYCALNPVDPKCVAAFCVLHPTDPLCQSSTCQQNPANPACTFCSLYPQDPTCQQVDCTTNPNSPACAYCILKPMDPVCLSYCQNHPADPACVVVEPYCKLHPEDPACKSDICKTNPATPACAYCILHSEDPNCQSAACQQNSTATACQFCTLYPEDKKCKESVCATNPADPACQTPYCDLHPEDSACKTEACKANPNLPGCSFCALHPSDPTCAPSICQTNPSDPSCPPTGESFCKLHPDDQKCKKDFCILNPADVLCQPGYCESHPFDDACLTKATNKKLTELIGTVATVVEGSKDIAQQGLEKLPGNTSTAFSLAAFSSLVVAPVITAESLSMPVYGLINGVTGAVDLWLWLVRLWYWLLSALGFRRKRKVWGTVYDSVSKQPLDPVMVSLMDEHTKEVVDQSITDMAGRYGFLDRSGTFTISAQKTNYQFPSKRIAGKSDEIYDNLYYGEAFSITNVGSSVVAPNIPMDPLAFDWNQMDKQRIIKLHPQLEYLKNLLFTLLFYSGFVFTLLLALILPSALHIIFLVFYLVITLVRWLVPSQRLWGQVYLKSSNQLMPGVVLELTPPNLNVILGRAKTGDKGRFFLKAQSGKYLLNVYSSSAPDRKLLGQFSVTVGKRGVVNGVFRI